VKLQDEMKSDLLTMLRDPSALNCQDLGQEELDGVLCDRIYVTGAGEDYQLLYLDAASHLPVMVQSKGTDPMSGSPVVQKLLYQDYKAYSGIQVAQILVILHDDQEFAKGTLKSFSIDPKVDGAFFAKP
jgi:hypothetical protein